MRSELPSRDFVFLVESELVWWSLLAIKYQATKSLRLDQPVWPSILMKSFTFLLLIQFQFANNFVSDLKRESLTLPSRSAATCHPCWHQKYWVTFPCIRSASPPPPSLCELPSESLRENSAKNENSNVIIIFREQASCLVDVFIAKLLPKKELLIMQISNSATGSG